MGLLNQIAVNSLYRFVFLILQFIITIFVSRLIGTNGLGMYSLILANVNILIVFTSLGIPSGITFHAAKNDISLSTLLKIAFLTAVIQIVLIVGIEFIHWINTGRYFIWPEKDWTTGFFGVIYFISLLITERYFALYNGRNLQKWYNVQLAIFSFLTLLPLIYWILQSEPPKQNSVILWLILVSVLQMVVLALVFSRFSNERHKAVDNSIGKRNRFFTYSMLAYLANSLQFLVYRIDYWILNYFHGEAELGLYALSVRIGQTLWIFPALLATVMLPHITSAKFENKILERLLRLTNTINLVASTFMGLLSFILIPFIFGHAFTESIYPLLIMIPGLCFVSTLTLVSAYFAGKNKILYNLKATILTLVSIVILDFVLIPQMGKVGAAIACSIAYSMGGLYIMKSYADLENYSLMKIFIGKEDIEWLRQGFSRISLAIKNL